MTTTNNVTDIELKALTGTSATFYVWHGDAVYAKEVTIDVPNALFDDMLADAWARIETAA